MPMCGSTCWRVPTACGYAVADFATVPGDGIDGYARDIVVGLATGFAQAPRDYSHVEAASLTTVGFMVWGRWSTMADGRQVTGSWSSTLGECRFLSSSSPIQCSRSPLLILPIF